MSGFRVYVSPPDVNERNIRTLMYTLSIGWVTADVSGRVSSIPVYLKTPAIKGVTYTLTDKLGEQIEVVVTDNVRTGYVNLPIQPQTVDVLKDEYILTSSSYLNTILQNDPGRIQESLEQDRNVNDLGRLNETIAQGAVKSTISLSNVTDSFRLLAGQQLILIRNAGITGTNRLRAVQETLQVDVDQDVIPDGNGIASITFIEKTFLHSHNPSLSFLIRPIFAMVGDINAATEAQDATEALLESAKQFGSDLIFEASDRNTITWGAGTIAIQDGTVYNIDAGSFNLADNVYRYIYYTRAGSTLSITTTLATAVQTGNILLATTRRGTNADQRAWVVPAVGKLYLSEENLAPNSVTANKIFVNQLSAVSANMGTLTAGQITIVSSGNTVWLNPNASLGLAIGGTVVGSAPFRVAYSGAFTATNATITGSITATSGAITGNLSVTGTLTMGSGGKITNSDGDYEITRDGFTLFQRVTSPGDVETNFNRAYKWLNSSNPTYEVGFVSYGGTAFAAKNVDLSGIETNQALSYNIRRNINVSDVDFGINIAHTNGAFKNGLVAGDVRIISKGKLYIQGSATGQSANNGIVVDNARVGIGIIPTGSYKFEVQGTSWYNGALTIVDTVNFPSSSVFIAANTIATPFINGDEGWFDFLRVYNMFSLYNGVGDRAIISYIGTDDYTYTIPSTGANGTFAFINIPQTWSANQTFQDTRLRLQAVSSGGIATLSYAATANNRTFTIPAVANGTFAFINIPQSWSANQTINANLLMGSSGTNRSIVFSTQDGGSNTITISLTAENGGAAGNKTVTIPNATGTLVTTANYNQDIAGTKRFTGTLRASQYRSSDNTVGQTKVVVTSDINLNPLTLNFKNGIFVGTS